MLGRSWTGVRKLVIGQKKNLHNRRSNPKLSTLSPVISKNKFTANRQNRHEVPPPFSNPPFPTFWKNSGLAVVGVFGSKLQHGGGNRERCIESVLARHWGYGSEEGAASSAALVADDMTQGLFWDFWSGSPATKPWAASRPKVSECSAALRSTLRLWDFLSLLCTKDTTYGCTTQSWG